jgi:hypothetical protein
MVGSAQVWETCSQPTQIPWTEPPSQTPPRSSEQAFFNQKGFVTDSMPEVDASQELLRTQKDAKVRNREDQIKSGSLD